MSPLIIEFQMLAEAFLIGFGNRVRGSDTCLPDLFALPGSPCFGETMLDHAAFGDPILLPSETPGVIRIELPLTLVIVEKADLTAHGEDPTPACQTVEATLRFDVSIDVAGGVPALTLTFAGLDAPDLSVEAATALSFIAIGLFPAQSQPFNLGQLGALLGGTPAVAQGRIAVTSDGQGQRMALRFVIEGGALLDEGDWQTFDGGGFTPASAADWTVLVSGGLIENAVEGRLADGLEESEADGAIDVEKWPKADFMSLFGQPTVVTKFEVEAIDACVCLWGEIDLDVDVTTTLFITVPEPDALQTDLHLEWDLDDAEVICCAFTGAMLWPFIGTQLLLEGKLDWGELIGGLFLLPVTFSVFVFAAHGEAAGPIASAVPDGWEEISEATHYRMRSEVNVGAFGIAFALENISVQAGGLVLAGSLTPPAKRHQPKLGTTVFTFADLPWAVENPCDASEKMVVAANGEVSASPTSPDPAVPFSSLLPLTVCDARVIDDAKNQFTPYFSWKGNSASVVVPHDGLVPAYTADPYPCHVQIVTSAGVRVVSLGSLPPITDEEATALIEEAETGQVINCNEWVHQDFWHAKVFLPQWLPDPPTDAERYVQQWHVVATGLTNRERVIVQNAAGEPVAELIAIEGSPASVELLVDLAAERGDETGVGLLRSETTLAESREIAIQQLVLSRVGSVFIGTPAVSLCAVARGEGPSFAAATVHGVGIYDVGTPAAARLIDYLPIDGLGGILPWRDGILAWGGFGLRTLGTSQVRAVFSNEPVRGAGVDGRRLYVLGDDALVVYDRDGRERGRSDATEATSLAVGDGVVALADRTGLRALDGVSLTTLDQIPLDRPTALTATRYGGTRAAFFVQSGGRELVYAVHARHGLIQVAEYARRPLLVDAARSGQTYAVLTSDRRTVVVYAAGRSATQRR